MRVPRLCGNANTRVTGSVTQDGGLDQTFRAVVFNGAWLSSKFVHVSQRLRILTAGALDWTKLEASSKRSQTALGMRVRVSLAIDLAGESTWLRAPSSGSTLTKASDS
jgi:hypothetical protein